MPSVYNEDSQTAAAFGAPFQLAKVKAGTLTFGSAATTDALAHGLGAAPDFVMVSRSEATGLLSWAATDTTTLTVTRAGSTTGAETWSYLVGVLA